MKLHEQIEELLKEHYPDKEVYSSTIKTEDLWDGDGKKYIKHTIGLGHKVVGHNMMLRTLPGQCSTVVIRHLNFVKKIKDIMPEIEEILGQQYSMIMLTARGNDLRDSYIKTYDRADMVRNKRTNNNVYFITKKI